MTQRWTESAPDIVGEIIAFRAWRVDSSVLYGLRLESMNGVQWPTDDWLYAHCVGYRTCQRVRDEAVGGDPVPGVGCSCGIYAARDRGQLVRDWAYNRAAGVVIGEVGLAGRIIAGTMAYRAERARPLRLYVRHADWRLAKPLAEAYRIPVELTNILTEGGTHGNRTAV